MEPGIEVAPGVYRLGMERVSFYLLEEGGRLTLVDAGCTSHAEQLVGFLGARGWSLDVLEAVLLTHAHPDHVGFAEQARTQAHAAVWIHEQDAIIAQGGDDGRSSEAGLWAYLWRAAFWRTAVAMARGGCGRPPVGRWAAGPDVVPVAEAGTFTHGETLEVPGTPRVVHVPGHSRGSAALYTADCEVVFTGDALVTWNPLTGRRGPQIMPAALNEDSSQALESLQALEELPAEVVLPGHGPPWTQGAASAVTQARQSGRS